MFYKFLLIILEIIAFFSMGIFSNFNYLEETGQKKKIILWRIVCILPLIILSLISFFETPNIHNIVIALIILLSLFADIVLLKNFVAGGIMFTILHLFNISMLIVPSFKLEYIYFIILLLTISSIILIANIKNTIQKLSKKDIPIFFYFVLYALLQIFGIFVFFMYKKINQNISLFMTVGGICFLICDIQVIVQYLAKRLNKKYNDELHIIFNNIFYYSALILFIISTF